METQKLYQMPVTNTAEVGGIKVDYYEIGSGDPLILLHGWPQTSYVWRKMLAQLSKHYHVFAIDLPGMGNNNALPTADTRTVARFIKSFCDQFALEKIHLMAHDIGSWVATAFALEFEENLRSLVVLDGGIPGLIPDEVFSPLNAEKIWQFYFHAIDGMPEFLIDGKEKEYLTWYFTNKTTVKDAISEADMDVYISAYTGRERLRNGFDYYRSFAESVIQNKAYQHKLSVPILAIGGANSQGLNMGRAMQKISNNEVQSASIPDCGHYLPEEQPQCSLNLLSYFWKKIE